MQNAVGNYQSELSELLKPFILKFMVFLRPEMQKRSRKLPVEGTFGTFGTFHLQEHYGPIFLVFLRPEMQNAVQNCQSELSELSNASRNFLINRYAQYTLKVPRYAQ